MKRGALARVAQQYLGLDVSGEVSISGSEVRIGIMPDWSNGEVLVDVASFTNLARELGASRACLALEGGYSFESDSKPAEVALVLVFDGPVDDED